MSSEFNIGYSHSGCIKLLARLGFEYRKPKALPRVSDVEKQAAFIAFYENLLNNLPADAPFVEPTTVDGVSSVQLLAKIEARNP